VHSEYKTHIIYLHTLFYSTGTLTYSTSKLNFQQKRLVSHKTCQNMTWRRYKLSNCNILVPKQSDTTQFDSDRSAILTEYATRLHTRCLLDDIVDAAALNELLTLGFACQDALF